MSSFQHFPTLVRDYLAEISSCVEVSLPNWNVQHLSLWAEMVDTRLSAAAEDAVMDVDLEAAEEATNVARFQEVKSKIALLALIYPIYCS